jgi:hypothetical protein
VQCSLDGSLGGAPPHPRAKTTSEKIASFMGDSPRFALVPTRGSWPCCPDVTHAPYQPWADRKHGALLARRGS